jgi:hypothetical protein
MEFQTGRDGNDSRPFLFVVAIVYAADQIR